MLGSTANQLLLKFEIDREYYGLMLEELTRIIELEHVLQLPKTPPGIYGVANYKGKIITIANIAYIIKKTAPSNLCLGLLNGSYSHIGLMINDKIETLMVSKIKINPLSESTINSPGKEILQGELLIENCMIQIISPNKLYNYLFKEMQFYLRKEFNLFQQN